MCITADALTLTLHVTCLHCGSPRLEQVNGRVQNCGTAALSVVACRACRREFVLDARLRGLRVP